MQHYDPTLISFTQLAIGAKRWFSMTTLCRFDTKDNGIESKSRMTFSHPLIPFIHINKVVSSYILKSTFNDDYIGQKTKSFDGILNNMWYIPSS